MLINLHNTEPSVNRVVAIAMQWHLRGFTVELPNHTPKARHIALLFYNGVIRIERYRSTYHPDTLENN